MFRLSKKADYAVFALGHLVRSGACPATVEGSDAAHLETEQKVVSAQEIADLSGLGKSTVANLLKDFTRDGILESTRGLKGGYRLVVNPAEVSLARILRVVDGPFELVSCASGSNDQANSDHANSDQANSELAATSTVTADASADESCCSLESFCSSRGAMQIVHDRIATILATTRLDELAGIATLSTPTTPPKRRPAPIDSGTLT